MRAKSLAKKIAKHQKRKWTKFVILEKYKERKTWNFGKKKKKEHNILAAGAICWAFARAQLRKGKTQDNLENLALAGLYNAYIKKALIKFGVMYLLLLLIRY